VETKHPDQIIYVNNKQVRVYNPYNDTSQQISNFNPAPYSALHFGKYISSDGLEAQLSYDGDMIVVSGMLADGTTPVAFAYNLQTDTKYPEFNPSAAPGAGDHDWISIDASGQVIVRAHQGGNDITHLQHRDSKRIGLSDAYRARRRP
jgi:hypothetical protein